MHKVRSTKELHKIKQLGNTVYLRKNINLITVKDQNGSHEEFEADEVVFQKEKIDLQRIHDNFDLYWDWAEEKEQKEQLKKEKEKIIRELVNNNKLADLKKTVDMLVNNSL